MEAGTREYCQLSEGKGGKGGHDCFGKVICMYVCMYVCMHACIYVYMYICIYVCIRPSSDLVQALLLRLCPAIHAPQLKEALCRCIVLLSFVLVSVVFYLAVKRRCWKWR